MTDLLSGLPQKLTDATGGPARRRAILLLAGVLSLETADGSAVGAMAAELERAFRIGNTKVGLLITASLLIGALASVPMGVLADKTRRVRVLTITILMWSAGMVASGLAGSYTTLLLARVALGLVTASAGPMVASLTGDLFPATERARIYGMVLTGELVGAGAGLLLSANLAAFAGWRMPFFVLAAPGAALACLLHRRLPEPARAGQSWLRPGATEIEGVDEIEARAAVRRRRHRGTERVEPLVGEQSEVRRRARETKEVEPRSALVLHEDPTRMSPWAAAAYILRIPSNLVLIGASILGYFFLAGVRSFSVLFAQSHFQLGPGVVTVIFLPIGVGAVAGTLWGGRFTDTLVRRGKSDARVVISGAAFVLAALLFIPGLVSSLLWLSLPFLVVAAFFLTVPNPPLDAARLDVVPSRLWGRGEGVRTFAQSVLQAFAPLTFGYISSQLGGPHANLGAGVNSTAGNIPPATGTALGYTFLIMLAPLLAAGILLLCSRKAYLRDVATADLSEAPRGVPTTRTATEEV